MSAWRDIDFGWIILGVVMVIGASAMYGQHQKSVRYTACVEQHTPAQCKD